MQEPQWTKAVPSGLICDWYYYLFFFSAVIAAVILVSILYLAVAKKGGVSGLAIFMLVIQLAASVVATLFLYLMCERSIGAGRAAK
jgi:hypothetical protein